MGQEGQIYEAYLSVKNPLDLTKYGTKNVSINDFISKMESLGVRLSEETIDKYKNIREPETTPVYRFVRHLGKDEISQLKKLGYDGIIQKENNVDGKDRIKESKTTAYIVFEPSQIKSINNQGTFSKKTGNIYYQKKPKKNNNEKQLSETEKRHKEIAYDILEIATGKSKVWLKSTLESNSNSEAIIKRQELIEKLINNVEDEIYHQGGMRSEWLVS